MSDPVAPSLPQMLQQLQTSGEGLNSREASDRLHRYGPNDLQEKKRFLERLDNPLKNWKFCANDIKERAYWDDYMKSYEDMIRHTASKHSPWYVVPADNKWFTRLVVAAAVIDTLDSLNLSYPKVGEEARRELEAARQQLLAE